MIPEAPRKIVNIAASVHQRLMNRSKEFGRPFNEMLQRFAIERFVYRLSVSPHANKFVLKGALMLSIWSGQTSRPTMDIDLLGIDTKNIDSISDIMKSICNTDVEADGVIFDSDSVLVAPIAEDTTNSNIRVRIRGTLGKIKVMVQVDIGSGDIIIPGPRNVIYPAILDFSTAELSGYSKESAIAEKFQAMVMLGLLNSRMKDFYDIWTLCRMFDYDGVVLSEAIETTFRCRNTLITTNPTVFERSFTADRDKEIQWRAFIRKSDLGGAPEKLEDVVLIIKDFIKPVLVAFTTDKIFTRTWKAPGPWR